MGRATEGCTDSGMTAEVAAPSGSQPAAVGDDELSAYDNSQRGQKLLQEYKAAEAKFYSLVEAVHLPFLDVKLYRKYFMVYKSEDNLEKVRLILDALEAHKLDTVHILKGIYEREQVVNVIKLLTHQFQKGQVSTLEVQTKVLQLLHSLQQVTLRIVDGIQRWRSRLTRPYAFEWRGVNYLFKILKDSAFVDTSALGQVLPLQLYQHPLCSNLNTLNLFGPATAPDTGGMASDGGSIAITYPMMTSKKVGIPTSADSIQRLQEAESIVASEQELQIQLLQELAAVSRSGCFLTVLDIATVVPNGKDGIRLNNKKWDRRLGRALTDTYAKYTRGGRGVDPLVVNLVPPGEGDDEEDDDLESWDTPTQQLGRPAAPPVETSHEGVSEPQRQEEAPALVPVGEDTTEQRQQQGVLLSARDDVYEDDYDDDNEDEEGAASTRSRSRSRSADSNGSYRSSKSRSVTRSRSRSGSRAGSQDSRASSL